MESSKKLSFCLLLLRLSVFLVFLMWTLDKFIRPDHASKIFENFYFAPAFGSLISYIIGGLEMVLIMAFFFGIRKNLTYGLVLILQIISTVSCYKQYTAPFESFNLLLFAGWPMLAACITLYLLRDEDTLCTLKS